ncbi:MAG: peptidase G2 autoproteolytic cleavage domain-containing protein [Patescibacteria group bacterium]|nr:hypothetical protein [Patescibacteria group bacterium]
MDGNAGFMSISIGGHDVSDSFGEGGVFINDVINDRLDTSAKLILGEFQFQDSGALAIKTDESNGLWLSPTGLLSKYSGAVKMTIPVTGNPTFAGDITGATGTFGSVTIVSGSISWATVTGSGKPADSATVGAQFGVNISGGGTGYNQIGNNGYVTYISGNSIVTGTLYANLCNVVNINADNINAGTIVGRTLIANNGSGADIVISNDGTIYYKMGGSTRAYSKCDGAAQLIIDSDNNVILRGDSVDVDYEQDSDGADIHWRSYGGNLRMRLTSGGAGYVDSGFYNPAGDYAEFFESVNKKEIPVGTSVILVGDRIRPAKKGEEPLGVISGNPAMVGNCDIGFGENWSRKYLTDEFGRRVYEEVDFWSIKKFDDKEKRQIKKANNLTVENGFCDEIPAPNGATIRKVKREKINPGWDKNEKYISRMERPEWNIVGLLGQIPVKKNQPIGKNWIRMREVSKDVDLYFVR